MVLQDEAKGLYLAHIIAAKIHQHDMLCPFLFICQQLFFKRQIRLLCVTSPPCACQWPAATCMAAQEFSFPVASNHPPNPLQTPTFMTVHINAAPGQAANKACKRLWASLACLTL